MRTVQFVSLFTFCLAAAGCRIEGGLNPSRTGPSQPAQPPQKERAHHTGTAERGGGGGGGGGGGVGAGGGGVSYSPDCPTPQDHCLTGDDVLVAKKAYGTGYVYLEAAVQQSQPEASGEAKFMSRRNGETVISRHFHQTRPASVNELSVGRIAVMFHGKKKDGIYQPPPNREKAHSGRWWMARIASVAPASNGYVIVAQGYKIATTNLRYIEGDESPTAVVGGAEDAHFLRDDHWIIGEDKLPDSGYDYVGVGAPIQAPSAETRGEGHFIRTRDGQIMWTEHAWSTRPATKNDIQVGHHIIMFHGKKTNGVYQAPRSRADALSGRWWTAKVVDDSRLYKNVVGVAGGYQIALDNARVIVE